MQPGLSAHSYRKSELLNISINEILLILVFTLLIFTHFAARENKSEISIMNKQLLLLEKSNTSLEKKLATLKIDNRTLRNTLKQWKEKYATLISIIAKYVSDAGTLTPVEVADRLDALLFASGANKGDANIVAEKLAKLNERVRELEKENEALKNKVKELERLRTANKGGGLDRPRCVVTGYPEIIKFLYEITMQSEGYSVRALWHERFDPIFFNIPGVKEIGRVSRLSEVKFRKAADKIYRWSDNQIPQCRFYVTVLNRLGDVRSSVYQRYFGNIDHRFYIRKMRRN